MNIINDRTYNLYHSFLNNDNWYMKVTLKSKLIEVARLLISADYCEFQIYIWHIRLGGILKDIFVQKMYALYAVKYDSCFSRVFHTLSKANNF